MTARGVAGASAAVRDMTEKALQTHVIHAAKQLHYRVYHTWMSARSDPGFPDLVLLRDGRMIVAELKRDRANPTVNQLAWLAEFAKVERAEVYTWRPADWDSGLIIDILRGDMIA